MNANKNRSKAKLVLFTIAFLSAIILPTVLINGHTALAFAGGSGTSSDPYQITTPAELASVSSYLGSSYSTKYFKLMNNIDLGVSPYNTGSGWTPIGTQTNKFYGHFDGNDKIINNLYESASYDLGLFGEIAAGATVQNLELTNVNITGSNLYIGALVGTNYGTIQDVGVSGGTVTGMERVGGLVGSDQGTMAYDFANVAVTFSPLASTVTCCGGGLTGEVYSGGTLHDSYSRSTIYISNNTGTYDQGSIGGVLGNDYSSGAKSNLYSTGSITIVSGGLPSGTGALSGGQYTSISSSFWDTQTSGLSTSYGGAGVVGKLTSAMKTQTTYSGWDFTNTWAIDTNGVINNGYPYLQWQTLLATNQSPNAPSSLGSSSVTTGAASTNTQPSFSFSLTDPNSGDTVKYEIQIANSSGFSSPTVDYTSALAAQGSASFSVGQAAGSGTYTTGSSGQTLADGTYYWRVKAIDNSNASSAYSVANGGAVAFIVDTTPPTIPGTPATATPTSNTTPTWTWTASTDGGSGLASPAYSVQWSKDSTFTTGVTSSTSTTNSLVQPSALSDGTWYFRVKASDLLGNVSVYSSAGSVVVDTTAPSVPGLPTATSPTNNAEPTVSWTASTDTGAGVASYTLEWSNDPTFTSYSSASTSLTHYTLPVNLSDGTWYFRVKVTDNVGNASPFTTNDSIIVDTTAPTLSTTIPANNLTAVSINPTLSMSFSEPVLTNSGNLYLYRYSDNSLVDTIPITSGQVSGSGTATIAAVPDVTLTNSTEYYVLLDNGAITDLAGNNFNGIHNSSIWSFTTVALPPTAPVVASPNGSTAPTTTPSTPSILTATTESTIDTAPNADTPDRPIILNDYSQFTSSTGNGKEVALQTSQVVYFMVSSEHHSATIDAVGSNFATFTLASKPQRVTLAVGQSGTYDVNGDGIKDIKVTLLSITNGVADFAFKRLVQPTASHTKVATLTTGNGLTHYSLYLIIIVAILLVLFLYRIRKRRPTDSAR